MSKDYINDCVKDLLMYYEDRDFIQMAFAYDEIQMHKGLKMVAETTFFTEILENNSIVLPKSVLKKIEYGGEPVLVSVQKKWKHVSFDTMYEGVTLDKIPMPEDVASPLELIRIDSDCKIALNVQCVETLDAKVGDIVLISAMSEGFYITKFTENDIKSFL